jgi:hypothetical protein
MQAELFTGQAKNSRESRAAAFAFPVIECAGIFLYMAFVMLLKRTAYIRLEKPLVIGRGKKLHIYRKLTLLVNLDNLHLLGLYTVPVQIFHQAANRVRKVAIKFIAPFNNADSGLVGIGNALVVF